LQLGFHLHQDVQHGTVHHPNRTVVLEQRVLVQNVVDLGQDFGGKKKDVREQSQSNMSVKHLQKSAKILPRKTKEQLPLVIVVAKVFCSLATTARNSASSFS
jgi:hypothetical protein